MLKRGDVAFFCCWCRCCKDSVSNMANTNILATEQSKNVIPIWLETPILALWKGRIKIPCCVKKWAGFVSYWSSRNYELFRLPLVRGNTEQRGKRLWHSTQFSPFTPVSLSPSSAWVLLLQCFHSCSTVTWGCRPLAVMVAQWQTCCLCATLRPSFLREESRPIGLVKARFYWKPIYTWMVSFA